MKENLIRILIKRFDAYVKGVDFDHLDNLTQEELDTLMLRIADEGLFQDGRDGLAAEWTLECFRAPHFLKALGDMRLKQELTDDEHVRLEFYLQLSDVFLPLMLKQVPDLSQHPWNLQGLSTAAGDRILYNYITESPYKRLMAVLLKALCDRLVKENEPDTIILNKLSQEYGFRLGHLLPHNDEEMKRYAVEVEKMTDTLFQYKNHVELGKRLGLTPKAQAVYDMMDTFVYAEYDYHQVDAARELAQWIDENWPKGEDPEITQELLDALNEALEGVLKKYDIRLSDKDLTWNYIVLDLLGVPFDWGHEEDEDEAEDWLD